MEIRDLSIGEGSYGLSAKAVPHNKNLPRFLRITDLGDDGTLDNQIVSTDHEEAEKYLLKENDIVFARTGKDAGKSYFYDPRDGKIAYASFLIRFTLDPKKVNPKYVKYYCLSKRCKDWIYNFNGGDRNINRDTLGKMPISLPSRDVQENIVSVLSGFDEKMRLNKRIEKKLTKQTELLYRESFTHKHYPQGKLSDLVTLRYGKAHKGLPDGNVPVYGSGGILRYVDRVMYEKESVLIPRKGTLENMILVREPFFAGDTLFYTEERIPYANKYVYHFLKNMDMQSLNVGSAVPSMSMELLSGIAVPIPDEADLKAFDKLVEPLYQKILISQKEREKLLLLRNVCFEKKLGL